ncbi:hypothetical protein [Microbacterium rhizosphaerae]|uniref:DUF4913 domain-containing protein n=1 Tax=Microbacterium rhizosphaerae TaxID=1678237 RepID=A0ABZ0SJZ0_9MICO|nr:hypothetical protein [Microbacterium rhizosphaerae]WPR89699.1 hypothetical protein SM116_18375 [Microbacterium rhizosphaerae]
MDEHPEGISVEELVASLQLGDLRILNRDASSADLGAQPVNWRELKDDDARATWDALRDWVEWVTTRYEIPEIIVPVCWWRHGALVEELSALHIAWEAAFDSTDSGLGPVLWHEKFAAARARLKSAYPGSCVNGHRERPPRSWRDVTNAEEWDAWADGARA